MHWKPLSLFLLPLLLSACSLLPHQKSPITSSSKTNVEAITLYAGDLRKYNNLDTYVYLVFENDSQLLFWLSHMPPQQMRAQLAKALPFVSPRHSGRYQTKDQQFGAKLLRINQDLSYVITYLKGTKNAGTINLWVLEQRFNPQNRLVKKLPFSLQMHPVKPDRLVKASPCSQSMQAYDIKPTAYACHYDRGFRNSQATSGWSSELQFAWSRIAAAKSCGFKIDEAKLLQQLHKVFGLPRQINKLVGTGFHLKQINADPNFCTPQRKTQIKRLLPAFYQGDFSQPTN